MYCYPHLPVFLALFSAQLGSAILEGKTWLVDSVRGLLAENLMLPELFYLRTDYGFAYNVGIIALERKILQVKLRVVKKKYRKSNASKVRLSFLVGLLWSWCVRPGRC